MTLLNRLQGTRAWLTETKGRMYVQPSLTLAELDRVIEALEKIESRMVEQESNRKRLNNCA